MDEYGIYNIDFGTGRGHEQSGERPAIIVKAIDELRLCIAIPLTSNLEHLSLPYTMQINKASSTNLKENSVALIFQLRVVDEGKVTGRKIGRLEESQISKIKTLIKDMLAV